MSSCSKAPRGLLVLLRTDGIFTVNALSPSSSLRQCSHHYTIRAGQNLPDKEFRYLRTVIVTAAVHWGFSLHRKARSLTFQHWAGVSPYTSTFVLAQTYVFGKQLRELLSCGPLTLSTTMSELVGSAFFHISQIARLPGFCCQRPGLYWPTREVKLLLTTVLFSVGRKLATLTSDKQSEGADLIPKLRSLNCRVP
jgi:hypothetical protein